MESDKKLYIECYRGFLKIEKLLNFPRKILQFFHLRGKLFNFFLLICGTLQTLNVIATAVKVFDSKGDTKVFAVAAILGLAHTQSTVKIFSIFLNHRDVVEIFEWFHELHRVRQPELVSEVFETHLRKARKLTDPILQTFLVVIAITFITVVIYFNVSETLFAQLPLIPESLGLIHRTINEVLLAISVIFYISAECTMIFFGIYLIASLNILSDLILKLNESSNIPSVGLLLRTIIKLHIEILHNLEEFCNIFFFVMVQISSSVVLLLLNFYLLMNSMSDFLYYCMIWTILSQVGLYCLFGQIINGKSERIFTDLYQTKWYEMEISDQKALILMMKISQKSFTLKAAGMYDINLVMFVQIIKLGFSYCTILYTFM